MTIVTRHARPIVRSSSPAENTVSTVSLANALRQEMVPQTSLTAARHYVENLLAAFSCSVSINDANGLAELLRDVRVFMRDTPVRGSAAAGEILETFRQSPPAGWMTTGNLSVGFADNSVAYTATYQLWDSSTPHRCAEIGSFIGTLEAGPQVWYWREHKIVRVGAS